MSTNNNVSLQNQPKSDSSPERAQTIIRRIPGDEHNFSVLPNAPAQDRHLSYPARGMLWDLLSRPGDWEVRITSLTHYAKDANIGSPHGYDAVYRILNELIQHGYAQRERPRDAQGRYGRIIYYVASAPIFAITNAGNPRPAQNPSTSGKPTRGEPTRGKAATTNKRDTKQRVNKVKNLNSLRPDSVELDAKKNKSAKTFALESQEIKLAEHLLNAILQRDPEFKRPNIQAWARDIDRLLRLDGRRPEDVTKVIDWCQNDRFWRVNILSTAKLRDKYDQLRGKMNMEGDTNGISSKERPSSPLYGAHSDNESWPEPRVYN